MISVPKHYDVVVVGGGPSGLVSALTLQRIQQEKSDGKISILVLEKRGELRERSNTLLLDQSPVSALEELGVDVSTFTPSSDFTQIFPDSDHLNQYPLPHYNPAPLKKLRFSALFMIRRKPVFNIGINFLEKLLIERVQSFPEITLLFDSELGEISVKDKVHIQFNHQGQSRNITANYVIAADGSHSSTLKQLSHRYSQSPEFLETVISANFAQPGKGNTKYQTHDRSFEALSLASEQGTSVFVKIQPGSKWEGMSLENPSQRISLIAFLRSGAEKLGVTGDIGVGLSVLKVVINRSVSGLIKNRVFIIGDARHSGTPRVGLGANVAIMDALWAAQTIARLRSANSIIRFIVTKRYIFNSWLGTCLFSALSRTTKFTAKEKSGTPNFLSNQLQFLKGQLLMSFHWRAKLGRRRAYQSECANESLNRYRLAD